MATYVYETIPQYAGDIPRRFEIAQSMRDAALTRDPATGAPVRRVISGGYGVMTAAGPAKPMTTPAATATCAPGCKCHSAPRIPLSA